MSSRDDLLAVNHALRELVRMQLTGELEAEVAWRERRHMLESVEAAWDTLVEDAAPAETADAESGAATAEASAQTAADAATAQPVAGWRHHVPALKSLRLPLWALLLLFALATFIYVGSL